jgi:HPt (histidine-containing phosphotransfer) domain-containing protein
VMDTSIAGLFNVWAGNIIASARHLRKQAMQLEDETEEQPLDKIDRAIQQSSQELKRLSELYKLRGKSRQAQQIDETLDRLARRTEIEARSRSLTDYGTVGNQD